MVDYTTPQYSFGKPFRILIERTVTKILPNFGSVIWFTDGSKKDKEIDAGIYKIVPRCEIFPL